MAFHIKQNDTSPSISVELKDADNSAINLTGASVKIFVKSLGGTLKVNSTMVIVNASLGTIRYDWQAADTDTFGTYAIEFQATYSDGSIETFPNTGSIAMTVVKELN
jgi:hypothetical protein|tara:strand:- start:240 stop:560 length:321 start_codon:yes stop_codon:yes gene_type:complete